MFLAIGLGPPLATEVVLATDRLHPTTMVPAVVAYRPVATARAVMTTTVVAIPHLVAMNTTGVMATGRHLVVLVARLWTMATVVLLVRIATTPMAPHLHEGTTSLTTTATIVLRELDHLQGATEVDMTSVPAIGR